MTTTGWRVGVVRDFPEQLDRDRFIRLVARVVVLIAGDGEDGDGTTDGEAEEVANLADPVEDLLQARARAEPKVESCLLR